MKTSIACIVYENGKILIAHRNPSGDMGNRWEFPGGKVEEGEDNFKAIQREMMEEFSVDSQVIEKIASTTFFHRDVERKLDAYLVKFQHDGIKNPYILTEHTEYKWVKPEEIPEDNFVDSDLKIYPLVLEFLKKL